MTYTEDLVLFLKALKQLRVTTPAVVHGLTPVMPTYLLQRWLGVFQREKIMPAISLSMLHEFYTEEALRDIPPEIRARMCAQDLLEMEILWHWEQTHQDPAFHLEKMSPSQIMSPSWAELVRCQPFPDFMLHLSMAPNEVHLEGREVHIFSDAKSFDPGKKVYSYPRGCSNIWVSGTTVQYDVVLEEHRLFLLSAGRKGLLEPQEFVRLRSFLQALKESPLDGEVQKQACILLSSAPHTPSLPPINLGPLLRKLWTL